MSEQEVVAKAPQPVPVVEKPAAPAVAVASAPAAAPVPATPSPKKLNALETIEQDIANFFKQREEAIARVHAIDGAIQASQHLLGRLKANLEEAAKDVKAEVEKGIALVKKEL